MIATNNDVNSINAVLIYIQKKLEEIELRLQKLEDKAK